MAIRKKHIKGTIKNERKMDEMIITEEMKKVIDEDSVVKTEKFFPYFILDKNKNAITGQIYLTENQAYQLNSIIKEHSFLRR